MSIIKYSPSEGTMVFWSGSKKSYFVVSQWLDRSELGERHRAWRHRDMDFLAVEAIIICIITLSDSLIIWSNSREIILRKIHNLEENVASSKIYHGQDSYDMWNLGDSPAIYQRWAKQKLLMYIDYTHLYTLIMECTLIITYVSSSNQQSETGMFYVIWKK